MSIPNSNFYHSVPKKSSPLKIRNPITHQSHIMPSPSSSPFNIAEMPWSNAGKPGTLMEFNAVIRSMSNPYFTATYNEVRKRKSVPDAIPIPSKQFLTEETMAEHLSSLHLSSNYTAHNIDSGTMDEEIEPNTSHHVFMSPKELEDRLKKAQRISVCEEVRKFDKTDSILPKVLLQRIEKPCTALMLWQPPQPLDKLIVKRSESSSYNFNNNDEEDFDIDIDNNNSSSALDLNSMDVEM